MNIDNKLIYECCFVGIFTVCLWFIYSYFIKLNEVKNKDDLCILKKYNIRSIFTAFFIGVIFHLVLEYFEINRWQCEKKCYIDGTCELICTKKI